MNNRFIKIVVAVLCLSFCSGCFYWHKDKGVYKVKLDPIPGVVFLPTVATAYVLGPNPVSGVATTATFLGLGLATLSTSAVAVALQYPFIPSNKNLPTTMTDYEVPEFSGTEYEKHQESSAVDSEQQKINARQMKKWQKLRKRMLEQQFEKDFTATVPFIRFLLSQ